MAIDVYLQIEGVKGESADSTHKDWIECESVAWAISQPRSATSSTAGGHTAERAELSEISIVKIADLASPVLAQHCASGKTLAKAKFEFFRADGTGERVKYYEIELENVLIGHIAPSVGAGSIMAESVALKFSKVKWKYTQQKIGGGTGGNTSGGWDAALNKVV
ncbi:MULTISPECIES: type VI secretion system tube protein Hcp [Massilia]|uniref:Type VI secretion system tube protein Hcp n=1 Tax=Massilia rubra TaxID=2607910 RepID=A0ABX0LI04_9BURK|nr:MULTISPECIES: type VI secretion system tube protein Hcp [Massilia]NHZ32191.1 type VI secretion system tube protein Hcp [Massilia rubra]NHZ96615.1 type VI secretion system tube protein Hcp [Massilia sp. CCM 8734]